jgi:hypothetical protein
MAEKQSSTRKRGSNSKSGGSKRSKSGGSGSRSKKSSSRASSRRTPTASQRELPDEHSPSGGDSDDGGNMSKAEESQTGGKDMGRPPADEPDVYVYVPSVKVGELCVDVERLDAHLALRTQVANLVNLVAGVHLGVDKVKIDLKDVEAECELKVRLENTYNILDRTLTTLDENPQVVEQLLSTAGDAVEQTGEIGQKATQPGGTLSELSSGVGDSLGNLTSGLGDTFSSVAGKANPKQLVSGNGNASSNGSKRSTAGKAAATVGAAGALGLAGGALLGGRRRSLFHRRSGLQKLAGQMTKRLLKYQAKP